MTDEAVTASPEHAELPPLNADYSLSDEQVAQFWRDGFIVLRGVLSRDEVSAYGAVIRDTAMRRFAARDMPPTVRGSTLSATRRGSTTRACSSAAGSRTNWPTAN